MLIGPGVGPGPGLARLPRVVRHPAVPFAELPGLARAARVLIMPYADLPGHPGDAAAQAQGVPGDRPAGGRARPAGDPQPGPTPSTWRGRPRPSRGPSGSGSRPACPRPSAAARARLAEESWAAKARTLERWLLADDERRRAGERPSAPDRGLPMNTVPDRAGRPSEMPVVLDARVVSGTGGGPDKTILNSPRFLEPMGYRNLCAYLHPPGDPGFDVAAAQGRGLGCAPLIAIPDRGPWDWRVVTELLAGLPPREGRDLARPRLQEQRPGPAPAQILADAAGDDRPRLGQAHAAARRSTTGSIAGACRATRSVISVSDDLAPALPGMRRAAGSVRPDRERHRHPAIRPVADPRGGEAPPRASPRSGW